MQGHPGGGIFQYQTQDPNQERSREGSPSSADLPSFLDSPVSQTQPEPTDKKAPGDRAQRVSVRVSKMEGERRHVTEFMCRVF